MATIPAAYFASTSLDLREVDNSDQQPQDIYVEYVCYRRVDPQYFAWLRRRMESARRAFDAGNLPKAQWDELRGRFNRLQDWAIAHHGKDALQAAIRSFDPSTYAPPVNWRPEPFLFPKTGDWAFTHAVSEAAVRKVDAIREAAQAKGWSDVRLYQNRSCLRFPVGQDYGLVCFLGPDDELGGITETHIAIVHVCGSRRNALRFANADVYPPRVTAP